MRRNEIVQLAHLHLADCKTVGLLEPAYITRGRFLEHRSSIEANPQSITFFLTRASYITALLIHQHPQFSHASLEKTVIMQLTAFLVPIFVAFAVAADTSYVLYLTTNLFLKNC
jgi:hypothetical protein